MQWLRKAVDLGAGLDPSRDSVFADLRGTREFDAILSAVREATPPVLHSNPAFVIAEGDLTPENMAHDPKGKTFYLGSMRKGKVVRCSPAGNCAQFAGGLGAVLSAQPCAGRASRRDNQEGGGLSTAIETQHKPARSKADAENRFPRRCSFRTLPPFLPPSR
jgi:hypothetical protein